MLKNKIITNLLVQQCNVIITAHFLPERWLKRLEAMIEKVKMLVLGILRTMQPVEANL